MAKLEKDDCGCTQPCSCPSHYGAGEFDFVFLFFYPSDIYGDGPDPLSLTGIETPYMSLYLRHCQWHTTCDMVDPTNQRHLELGERHLVAIATFELGITYFYRRHNYPYALRVTPRAACGSFATHRANNPSMENFQSWDAICSFPQADLHLKMVI